MAVFIDAKSQVNDVPGGVTAPIGFMAAGVHSGVKRQKLDLSLLYSETPCRAAGTFTRNRVKAAPLLVTQEHLRRGPVRAVVINSGNANACNGPQGIADARRMAELVAEALGLLPREVLVASTGVIGEPLPMDKIERGIAEAAAALSRSGGGAAARGIMTTDTVPKEVAVHCREDGLSFSIGAMAKGSGMIHPNMATMLAFITTDADVEEGFLQETLREAVDQSFNMISVDGDTSTNDMALILANGASPEGRIRPGTRGAEIFARELTRACIRLARMIAADGEGATKLIEIRVTGAKDPEDARTVVRAIARSSLVKTAVYGEDPNWGRILCAAGYSGAEFDPDRARVALGDVVVFERGRGVRFDEAAGRRALQGSEVTISVDLGAGDGSATGWTCDLTYDYIKINASYRT